MLAKLLRYSKPKYAFRVVRKTAVEFKKKFY